MPSISCTWVQIPAGALCYYYQSLGYVETRLSSNYLRLYKEGVCTKMKNYSFSTITKRQCGHAYDNVSYFSLCVHGFNSQMIWIVLFYWVVIDRLSSGWSDTPTATWRISIGTFACICICTWGCVMLCLGFCEENYGSNHIHVSSWEE